MTSALGGGGVPKKQTKTDEGQGGAESQAHLDIRILLFPGGQDFIIFLVLQHLDKTNVFLVTYNYNF